MDIEHHSDTPSRWEGLQTRAVSAAALAVLALGALWLGGWIFNLLVIMGALLGLREWDELTSGDKIISKILGLFYMAMPAASLIWLRDLHTLDHPQAGGGLVLYVLVVVWATDIGAYFTGRRVGGPKLAPALSPNKTWAGLAGGIVAAAIAGGICTNFIVYPPSFIAGMNLAILLAVIAQGGDLFESWLKRRVGAKDSGSLIPGHGGLLDRVDGLIFTLPVFALLVYAYGALS